MGRPQYSSLSPLSSGQKSDFDFPSETADMLFRDEEKEERTEANTERPKIEEVNISKYGAGRNTGNLAMEEEEKEKQEEEDVVTRADLARIVSSHMQTIFRQLSDIDQRLNHIENQWNLKKNKKKM